MLLVAIWKHKLKCFTVASIAISNLWQAGHYLHYLQGHIRFLIAKRNNLKLRAVKQVCFGLNYSPIIFVHNTVAGVLRSCFSILVVRTGRASSLSSSYNYHRNNSSQDFYLLILTTLKNSSRAFISSVLVRNIAIPGFHPSL